MEIKGKIKACCGSNKENEKRPKVLVTGGTGYIGSHTAVELIQAGYEVVIIDNLSNSNAGVVDGIEAITGVRPLFENIDCMDYVAMDRFISANEGIDAIIHFAASKAVGESVQKPLMYYRNNVGSLLNILELMSAHKIGNLVFSSSCTVYGQPDAEHLPITEAAPRKDATSPYGNTKRICEDIITDTIHANDAFKSIILRYFNPIGAHPSALIGELPNGVPNNLLPFVTQTAAGLREKLRVFGNDYNTPDGTCIRDYINVVDLAKAHVLSVNQLLCGKMKNNTEIYNLGTGRGLSVLEIIKTFEKVTGVKVPHEITQRREGDTEQVWAAPKKANEQLGWVAQETVEDTLLSAWHWQEHLGKASKDADK